ncbi:MAG TPA: WcaI family glycosyltransferase [Terracidiphilus sp.]
MRILVVGINYAPDLIGVAKYNVELCEALVAFGHEVRVVTAPPYYPEWRIPDTYRGWSYRREVVNGVALARAPIYVPEKPTGVRRLLHHASFAATSLWPVLMTSLRWRPDVIFSVAPSLMSAAFSAWIARRTGALSWLHLQDFEVDAAFDLGLLADKRLRAPMVAIESRILRSFDRVSTISSQMLERLATKGVAKEKIREIRNWTDTDQIRPDGRNADFRKEQLGLDESQFVCLYSGTMSNKQGLDLIMEAAKLLDKAGSTVRFVLCGNGPHKSQLQQLASGSTNVKFLGLQEAKNFADLLNSADVHVIPQRAEAADLVLPSKLGGILASGKPVVVMARPGTGLANEIGNAGLVIPPGDAQALATALDALARDVPLCRTLGAAARKLALSNWDKLTIVGSLEKSLLALNEGRHEAAKQRDTPTNVLVSDEKKAVFVSNTTSRPVM